MVDTPSDAPSGNNELNTLLATLVGKLGDIQGKELLRLCSRLEETCAGFHAATNVKLRAQFHVPRKMYYEQHIRAILNAVSDDPAATANTLVDLVDKAVKAASPFPAQPTR